MARNIDTWPDLVGDDLFEMDEIDCGAAVLDDAGAVSDGFLEFEDDPMALEDRPGGLVLDPAGAAAKADKVTAAAKPERAEARPGKGRGPRRERIRPAEKSVEEMALNARLFHAWQRGERRVPVQWSVTDQWVWVR